MLSSFSHSFLTTQDFCGEKARRSYIFGEKSNPTVEAHIGRAFHAGIHQNDLNLMNSGVKAPLDEVLISAKVEYKKSLEQGIFFPIEELDNAHSVIEDGDKMIVRLLEKYYKTDLAEMVPIATEQTLVMDSGITIFGEKIPIKGIIDRVIETPEGIIIRDPKTSGQKWAQSKADSSYQATIYWKLVEELHGKKPVKFVFDTFLKYKREIKYVPVETYRNDEDFKALLRRLSQIALTIENGIHIPAPAGSWICTPQKCDFWGSCPYVSNRAKDNYFGQTGKGGL
jgi:CRISPR/Cas system-associated exonuclease Cas4 (RecB family)